MDREEEILEHAVARLNAKLLGSILGLLFGAALFLATVFLVLKDGPAPGPHQPLLPQYFPGNRLTFKRTNIRYAYGIGVGFVIGAVLGAVYNRLAHI